MLYNRVMSIGVKVKTKPYIDGMSNQSIGKGK